MKKYFSKFLILALVFTATPFSLGAQSPDVMTTFSGAQFIAGVNWGNVTTTDHSITISNAHVIPMNPSGGAVGFTVEWGTGSPEQNSSNYEPINITQPYTLGGFGSDNYVFNITFNNLTAATDYYFTIREINPYEAQPGVTDYGYNLFTYGFATTENISDANVEFQYSNNNTSVNISGNLILSNGQGLMGQDIILQIFEVPPGTTLFDQEPPPFSALTTSPIITTGGPSVANGAGYFQYTFDGSVNPGSAYYLLIKRGIDEPDLVFPTYFEVPEIGGNATTTPPGGGPTSPNASTNGLIPCNGPDCNFDSLITLINNVVDFLIVFIAFPFVAIVAAWAGILLLTSGGSSSAKDKAKTMLWHVIIGLILALLSWGIIKIILVTLGYQGPLLGIFGIN